MYAAEDGCINKQTTKEYTRNETEMQEAFRRYKKLKTTKTAAEDAQQMSYWNIKLANDNGVINLF